MEPSLALPAARASLGADIRAHGRELALETVEEASRVELSQAPARIGRAARLGDLPALVAELGLTLQAEEPAPGSSAALAAAAREHVTGREALGFAPRDVVTELLLLRRVVGRFAASRLADAGEPDLLEVERRLNATIDALLAECVFAYFDRATAEAAVQAHRDPLTGLLDQEGLMDALRGEVARSERYDSGLTLVLIDVDGATDDRVLHRAATTAVSTLRGSDVAARLRGDRFAVVLLATDRHGGDRYLQRFRGRVEALRDRGELPPALDVSAGCAQLPLEAASAEDLLRVADERLTAAKRAKSEQLEETR